MLAAFRTEISPTPEQACKIRRTIGTCRYVYNLFIEVTETRYAAGQPYMSGYAFGKYLNSEYLPANPDKSWIKEASSKAIKKVIMDADGAYKKFFKHKAGHPRFKKKSNENQTMYFVNAGLHVERHRIKIPTIGWVRLKEFGYIPTKTKYMSGTVSVSAGRYYVSVIAEVPEPTKSVLNKTGIGIDLGVKSLAVTSENQVFQNINTSKRVRKVEKQLRRAQRKLSRKYESLKERNKKSKGEATRQNIQKQKLKVARIYYHLQQIRRDYENKVTTSLVRTKPAYIVLEDLNVRGMLKNRYLSKRIRDQRFYSFREQLTRKAKLAGIEVRIANRRYPSSKTCHNCKNIKKDLELSDRIYKCKHCGISIDRDLNAALNLRDTTSYAII